MPQFATYYLLACLTSWLFWAPLILGQDGVKLLPVSPPGPVLICAGTLGPTVACYLTHRLWNGNWRPVRFLPSRAKCWLWLLIGPSLILLCFFAVIPLLASSAPPRMWYQHVEALAGIPGIMFGYNLLGGPLFEQFGWRGFLLTRLQRFVAPWIAGICVGVLWAGWHLPLFLVDGWNTGPMFAFFLTCVGLAIVFTVPFNASGQSVASRF